MDSNSRGNTMREVMQNADKLPGPGGSPCGPPALEVRRLTMVRAGQTVLDAVDLQINAGQIVAVLGANGAGKTTFLRCCAALLRPVSGEVRWCGKSPWRDYDARRLVGMVAHESHLYASLTPTENLKFAATMYGVPGSDRAHCGLVGAGRPGALRERSDVAAVARNEATAVDCAGAGPSAGRPALRRAFRWIGHDGRRWLCETLVRLRDGGAAICCTTHELPLALQLANRILQLEHGRLTVRNCDANVISKERAWANAA